MPESIAAWWERRRFSKQTEVPYPVGRFRADWAAYPALVQQYDPARNAGLLLSQIPPEADVYVVWFCGILHEFVATPHEQRHRPGSSSRRSWCPECAAVRRPKRATQGLPAPLRSVQARRAELPRLPPPPARDDGVERLAEARARPGEAVHASRRVLPTSAAEADLRRRLRARLEYTEGFTAVRVAAPFHGKDEVCPDIVLPELRIAIEYDTTGRIGDEHNGRREVSDKRKDRLLRQVGWEVVRIRCGGLVPIGPFDLCAPGVSDALVDRLVDRLRDIRGLLVDAYLTDSYRAGLSVSSRRRQRTQ